MTGMVGTSCSDARQSHAQESAVWLVTQDSSSVWSSEEMEGFGKS